MNILVVSTMGLLWITVLMHIHVKIFVGTYVFNSFEYTVMRRISGSYHNSIFKLLRNFQTNFQSGCPTLNSYQQCMRVLISPYLHQEDVIFSIFYFRNPSECKVVPITVFFFLIFIFWLHWVFVAVRGLSLVVESGGYSSLGWAGFSLRCFSCCGARALGTQASVVVAHRLSSCGLRAREHRLSSCGAQA